MIWTFSAQIHARGMWPFSGTISSAVQATVGTDRYYELVSHPLFRSDICGWRWHMNLKKCVEATIEHLVWLLYSKFAHYTCTIAAFRILRRRFRGKGITLQDSNVLLKLLWLVMTLFGPCLQILNALIAMLANIYSILLFGTDAQILDVKETEEHASGLPRCGSSTMALLALALQSNNLL
eukprot:345367-Amphidinium_carterae.1